MDVPVAILDACILYSAPLRDVLLSLAHAGLFRAHWTEHLRDEYIRNLRANRPDLTQKQLDWTWDQMCQFSDALVTGYESRIATLKLPDEDDRHVLAAAIHAQAGVIVTHNLKDFPTTVLRAYGVIAMRPDGFLLPLLKGNPGTFCAALKAQRARLKKPARTVDEFLATLLAHGVKGTVTELRKYESDL